MSRHKKKRPVTLPPHGDIGPDTPAQRAGAVYLVDVLPSGQKIQRKRRLHALEIMAASEHQNGKRKKAEISARQCAAGLRLHDLWCLTEMTGDAPFTKVYVDTSPNPSAVVAAQIERVAAFTALSRHIPTVLRGPVEHVAIKSRQLRDGYSRDGKDASEHCAQLQAALDILADHLGQ